MPPYEITIFTRPLSKGNLIDVLERCVSSLLDRGAVVTSLQSLGHRDLPMRRLVKQTKEQVQATNSLLINCHMSISSIHEARKLFVNDLDVFVSQPKNQIRNNLSYGIVNCNDFEPIPEDCNLEELLKPPAYRKSVEDLKARQKIGHFARQRLYKRTEKEWRSIPKSYTISPPRA